MLKTFFIPCLINTFSLKSKKTFYFVLWIIKKTLDYVWHQGLFLELFKEKGVLK